MRRGTLALLFFIILLAVGAAYVVFWPTTNAKTGLGYRGIPNPFAYRQGLDLQGGVRVLLVPSNGQNPTQDEINNTQTQIEQRVNNGLGVSEPSIRVLQTAGQYSISVELPGLNGGNEQQQVQTLLKSGVLEFWDTGQTSVPQGSPFDPTQYVQSNGGTKPLFTGKDLDPSQLGVQPSQSGGTSYVITFGMQGSAYGRLSDFTKAHVGDYFTITLDRQVLTSPVLRTQLPGAGDIEGNFTLDQANQIVSVLKYGALPVPLKIASYETVSPTLGSDAIHKSIIAAIIGLSIVVLFMLLYYRLPGILADFALVLYALFTLALFKLVGVTLTLAGIAGFVLSIGMAVDANVLIFERIKEELRAGRLLASAIDIGWKRAWPSIRDSNISTLITCAVLFIFGSNFGASIIVGFATTLFLGVVVSMFTAVVVTRTFLNLLIPTGVINHPAFFGLPAGSIAAATASSSLARRNSSV